MLHSECIPANVTKEGSSGQSSSINANIATPKPNPSSSKNGIFIGEGLETQDSMFSFEVSDLNCIAHDFEQNYEHLCIYNFEWNGLIPYMNLIMISKIQFIYLHCCRNV